MTIIGADMITIEILKVLAGLGICFVIPGYLAQMVCLFRNRRDRRDSWWQIALGAVLASILWTGGCGVLMLQFDAFSLNNLLMCNVSISLVIALAMLVSKAPWLPPMRRLTALDGILILILVIVAIVYLQPHEFLWGGADAGVYVSLGESIANTGSWLVKEDIIQALPEALYPAFFRQQPPSASVRFIQFPGFYLTDPEAGKITPQFFPLHPLWLAIYNALGGLRFSLLATPVWGILGCMAVAAVAQTLFGARSGWLSLISLFCTATQIWFSRYPTAEMITQFLLFGGLWALIRYFQVGSGWYAGLAGAAIGQAMLARLDLYFLVIIPVALGVWRMVTGRFVWRDLLLPVWIVAHLIQSLVFAWTRSRPYFVSVYGRYLNQMVNSPLVLIAILFIAGAGFAAIILLVHTKKITTHQAELDRIWDTAMRVLSVGILIVAFYAYFIRPALANTGISWYYWYGDSQIANVEPYNMVRLGWYLTPLGLAMATFGAFLILRRRVTVDRAILMGVGLFFSVLFIQSSRNNPHHIYVMRRYVPVVIPFLVVMMAYLIDRIWSVAGKTHTLGPLLGLALGAWLVISAWFQITHIEYDGLIAQISPQVEALGEPAVILFNDDLPVSSGALLGTPLHYIYGHTVFDLQEEYVDSEELASQIAIWQASGKRVLLAEGSHAVPDLLPTLGREPVLDFYASYPVLEVSYEHKPREIWTQTMEVSFYEVADIAP
jgi:hypothetical protein